MNNYWIEHDLINSNNKSKKIKMHSKINKKHETKNIKARFIWSGRNNDVWWL